MRWRHTYIPGEVADQIDKVRGILGYPSLGSFVTEAARIHLDKAIRRVNEYEQERAIGRKVLGKDKGEL